jgi:hypothetical protein
VGEKVSKRDAFRDLLSREATAIRDEVIQSGGQVSAERLASLERLARLAELSDAVQPPRRKRWPVAVALGLTLLLVSILLFVRVPATEIELDLVLSEVSFVLSSAQRLSGALGLSALGVSGLREVGLPADARRDASRRGGSDGAEVAIRLSVDSSGTHRGTVDLAPLILPAGTQVWVRRTGVSRQYRISLKSPQASKVVLGADVNGPVRVAPSGAPAEAHDFPSPRAVVFEPGSDEVDLDVTFLSGADTAFSSNISVRQVSLFRIDEFRDPNRTFARRTSTILSGALYFESLNGQELKLRPGTGLQFERTDGEIRTLELGDHGLIVKFHGTVLGMTAGPGETRRNLMPTYLEWLTARHGLSLLWATTFYLFGLLLSALRWWRGTL